MWSKHQCCFETVLVRNINSHLYGLYIFLLIQLLWNRLSILYLFTNNVGSGIILRFWYESLDCRTDHRMVSSNIKPCIKPLTSICRAMLEPAVPVFVWMPMHRVVKVPLVPANKLVNSWPFATEELIRTFLLIHRYFVAAKSSRQNVDLYCIYRVRLIVTFLCPDIPECPSCQPNFLRNWCYGVWPFPIHIREEMRHK